LHCFYSVGEKKALLSINQHRSAEHNRCLSNVTNAADAIGRSDLCL
jgi:hypothetical protein